MFLQCDGLVMGSPITPILANFFLCIKEKKNFIFVCPVEFKPIFYRRYVDATFLLFKDPSHIFLFLIMNSQHKNIKFTHDVEKDNKLAFLDVNIKKNYNIFFTNVYRKKTLMACVQVFLLLFLLFIKLT